MRWVMNFILGFVIVSANTLLKAIFVVQYPWQVEVTLIQPIVIFVVDWILECAIAKKVFFILDLRIITRHIHQVFSIVRILFVFSQMLQVSRLLCLLQINVHSRWMFLHVSSALSLIKPAFYLLWLHYSFWFHNICNRCASFIQVWLFHLSESLLALLETIFVRKLSLGH
jgi:hypothetical protein